MGRATAILGLWITMSLVFSLAGVCNDCSFLGNLISGDIDAGAGIATNIVVTLLQQPAIMIAASIGVIFNFTAAVIVAITLVIGEFMAIPILVLGSIAGFPQQIVYIFAAITVFIVVMGLIRMIGRGEF